jgi:hypothetical protein
MKRSNDTDLLQLLMLDEPPSMQEQVFLATMLPGLQRMLTVMERYVELVRQRISALQQGPKPKPKPGPKPKSAAPLRSGWSTDPAERKAEMARRRAVAKRKKAKLEAAA